MMLKKINPFYFSVGKTLASIFILSSILVGCSSVPQTPTDQGLQAAQRAVQEARNNPITVKYASAELSQAEQTLRKAEEANSEEERVQLASRAQQLARQAVTTAESKARNAATSGKSSSEPAPVVAADMMTCEDSKIQRVEDLTGELKTKQTGRGWVLIFDDNKFETGKAGLLPAGKNSLSKVAAFLKRYPQRKAKIEGYTDNVGDRDLNLGLSQRRADEVRFALVNCGIDSTRVLAKGLGGASPIATNNQDAGRKQNWRVEVMILNEGENF